jgi:hypothetical protein
VAAKGENAIVEGAEEFHFVVCEWVKEGIIRGLCFSASLGSLGCRF